MWAACCSSRGGDEAEAGVRRVVRVVGHEVGEGRAGDLVRVDAAGGEGGGGQSGPVVEGRAGEDRQQTGLALLPLATCPPSQGVRRRFVGAPHDGGAVGDGTACGQARGSPAGRENVMRGA